MIHDKLLAFAEEARRKRAALPGGGEGTALELLLAPLFHRLLEDVLAERLPAAPALLPEYTKPGIGRPDLAFKRAGAPARAFVELKEPGKALSARAFRGHDRDQFRRFGELPVWALCNFHQIQLYRRAELVEAAAILPAAALDPATSAASAERLIRRADPAPFLAILDTLALAQPVPPRNAQEVAQRLAEAARLVREVVRDHVATGGSAAMAALRAEFRENLLAQAPGGTGASAADTALFANAFAQTLAFGLLLALEAERDAAARERRAPAPLGKDAWEGLPAGSYPLLRSTLRALTQEEVRDALGAAFDVALDTVNAVDPALLARRGAADRDPILYFYEDFLETFDPEARRRHGVYFTPVPVVRFMVAATDRALRQRLRIAAGFADEAVLTLDPACGTGTFLIAIANAVAAAVRAAYGEDALEAELQALAPRLHGFELLVGPYTVAHYRLLRELRRPAARLPIYLADTLAAPDRAVPAPRLGFMSADITRERADADEVKARKPVLVLIGNPPYRRLGEGEERQFTEGWEGGFWEDLKRPVREAGWGGELNTFPELSVAFWRWCLWKLFESEGAPRRGVVCFVTNRTFLAGRPYAGLRRMLRARFDRIEVLDLRGDLRGARPAAVARDEGVFDIQTGVCVAVAVADGSHGADEEAEVLYADAWRHGRFSEAEKLAWLGEATADPAKVAFAPIARAGLDDFVPEGFGGLDWPALDEVFPFRSSGVQTKRDGLVYGASRDSLAAKLTNLAATATLDVEAAAAIFHETGARRLGEALTALGEGRTGIKASYRPLDTRHLLNRPEFIDRPRPQLQAAFGADNFCLYAMPAGTGAGPALWVHGLLPDYHAFSGRGGYAFPLWDRRHPGDTPNIRPQLLAGLALAHGTRPTAQEVFDAVAALLSAPSYTSRFAWDLEECFPHVPLPGDRETFAEAARIGAEIRALAAFQRPPAEAFRAAARVQGRATGVLLSFPRRGQPQWLDAGDGTGHVPLQEDGSLRLSGVPARMWNFKVSGYPVLPRWFAAREGEAWNAALQREACDVVWRLAELLHWFDAAEVPLATVLAKPLTRAEAGLPARPSRNPTPPPVVSEDDDESDPA
jgi:hypothetical protein